MAESKHPIPAQKTQITQSPNPAQAAPAPQTLLMTLLQRAKADPNGLSQGDILQLQRAVGNRSVTLMLSRKPAAPTIQTNSGKVIQRATTINDQTWRDNHVGGITLDSGSDTDESRSVDVTPEIAAKIMEKDSNHFQTGHTVANFSFVDSNIERAPRSGFWPVAYGEDEVLDAAEAAITAKKDDIVQNVKDGGGTINDRSFESGNFKYVMTVTVEDETVQPDDLDAPDATPTGTARLEQFYPISGTGFLYADEADLKGVKRRLNK